MAPNAPSNVKVRAVEDIRWWCRDCELPAHLCIVQTLMQAQEYAKRHAEGTGHRTVAHCLFEDHYDQTD